MAVTDAIRRMLRAVFVRGRSPAGSIPVIAEQWGLLGPGLEPVQGGLIVGTDTAWTVLAPGPAGARPQSDPDADAGLRFGPAPIKCYALFFGGNINSTIERWLLGNGSSTDAVATAVSATTRLSVPFASHIRRILVLTSNNSPRLRVDVNGSTLQQIFRNGAVWGGTNFDRVWALSGLDLAVPATSYVEVASEGVSASLTRVVVLLTPDDVAGVEVPNGHLLFWGVNFTAATNFAVANGIASSTQLASSGGVGARGLAGFAGTLTHLAFVRTTVAADTVVRVHNVTAATTSDVTLPAAGVADAVAFTLAVAEGDEIALEFLSGTAPGNCAFGVRLLPTDAEHQTGYVDWFGGDATGTRQSTANYVPMGVESAALATDGAPSEASMLCPRISRFGAEGQGGILHSVLGNTEAATAAKTVIQMGPTVLAFDLPGRGRLELLHEMAPGELVNLSPDDDAGDTLGGLYWQ